MGRCEAALEQQPHRVALVAEGGLDPDEDVAELRAQHEDVGAVGLVAARRRAPLGLDLREVGLAAQVVLGRNAGVDVGLGAVALGIAVEDFFAQGVDALRHFDRVAVRRQALQRVEQRGVDRQERRRAGGAGIGREVEQHRGELPLGLRGPAERYQSRDPLGEPGRALGMDPHVPCVVGAGIRGAAAEHHRGGGAVEFGDRDHHGRLDRRQAAVTRLPLFQGLKLQRLGGEVGHIEPGQHRLGGGGVVVGGAADQREAGERDQRVDAGAPVLHEEGLYRRAVVEAAGEGRHHVEALRLQGGDDAVVMGGVAGEHVAAHHQQADPALGAREARQPRRVGTDPTGEARVVETGLRIIEGCGRRRTLAPSGALAGRVAVHEEAHQGGDVLVRARQPVLQGQEIGAHVLGRTRDEAQDLRQLAHQGHLPAGIALLARLAPQLLQEVEGAALGAAHVEAAELRGLHHLAGREAADHRVAGLAPGRQRRQDRPHVLVHEQHGREHDVGLRDVGPTGRQRRGIVVPLGGRVEAQHQPGHLGPEAQARPLHRARQVIVERDDDDADRRPSGRNALWHRRGSRG